MTTIQAVMTYAEIIKSLGTKKTKEAYITNLHPNIQQFLSASINMVGIGPELFQEITIGQPSTSLEGLVDAFDVASKIGSSNEKRTVLSGIVLTADEKAFVGSVLYDIGGSVKLGVTIPRISDGMNDVISAMLAKSKTFDLNNSIIEQKFDGHRCIARKVDEDTVILHSRNGKPMNVERVSEGLMDILPVGTITDGEIVAADGEFESLKIHSNNVTYQMFDCLYIDGNNIMDKSFTSRREKLESLDTTNAIHISEILDFKDMAALDTWVDKIGAEGIIAKDPHGTYRSGKRDWIKYKKMQDLNAKIVGWEFGKGKRVNVMGAIHVIPEGLTNVTKIGTGFSDQDLVSLTARLQANEQMNCKVIYQNLTKDGRLRFPVFGGLI